MKFLYKFNRITTSTTPKTMPAPFIAFFINGPARMFIVMEGATKFGSVKLDSF